jgi:zinc/manganese transport system substrate-binding protein
LAPAGLASDKPVAVATFSILADLTQRRRRRPCPSPDWSPERRRRRARVRAWPRNGGAGACRPADRQRLGEPWLQRLEDASGFIGKVVLASDGVTPLAAEGVDPHAFQDLANAQIYVANIAKGLSEAAPDHAADFKANADKLIAEITALDQQLKAEFGAIPQERRRVLTSHDAFHYFGRAYGIEFVSVQGLSTEAEPTADDLVKVVRQARDGHLSAIFLENMSDPRLETVAQETGAVGGESPMHCRRRAGRARLSLVGPPQRAAAARWHAVNGTETRSLFNSIIPLQKIHNTLFRLCKFRRSESRCTCEID